MALLAVLAENELDVVGHVQLSTGLEPAAIIVSELCVASTLQVALIPKSQNLSLLPPPPRETAPKLTDVQGRGIGSAILQCIEGFLGAMRSSESLFILQLQCDAILRSFFERRGYAVAERTGSIQLKSTSGSSSNTVFMCKTVRWQIASPSLSCLCTAAFSTEWCRNRCAHQPSQQPPQCTSLQRCNRLLSNASLLEISVEDTPISAWVEPATIAVHCSRLVAPHQRQHLHHHLVFFLYTL